VTRPPAIVVDGVDKRFRVYHDQGMLLQRLTHPVRSRRHEDLWALRDLSFTVPAGEALGIVGRNGSGKTTLLRLLAGVTAPTSGHLRVEGRRAPLIGVGVGFNHELTGRENVLVNGRLLGMTTDEVAQRYDDIVAFSEIDAFIDTPVKFYSSGMFLRLALSIALHTHPDIMLVDEVLAVGDIAFQSKCFDRMQELQDGGSSLVLVTHNLQLLQSVAPRTIILDRGIVVYDGKTEDGLGLYHEILASGPLTPPRLPTDTTPSLAPAGRGATVTTTVLDHRGRPTSQVAAHRPLTVSVHVQFATEVTGPIVGIAVDRPGLGPLFATANRPGAYRGKHGPDEDLHAEVRFEDLPLLSGTYAVRTMIQTEGDIAPLGTASPVLFHITNDNPGAGAVDLRPSILIEGEDVEVVDPRLAP
jgi:ABC-type polysaccharide/polyol phosphate transport system ATPase subunit